MSVFTQVAAALAWPVSRVRRREKEEDDLLQSDDATLEPRQNGADVEGDAAALPSVASGPRPFGQTNAAPVSAAAAGAGPTPEAAAPGQPSVPTPSPEASAIPPPKGDGPKDDILSLFTEDMAGNEDFQRLTPFLKDVDVYDLADECRAVAKALQPRR